jgi:hypothetical protein
VKSKAAALQEVPIVSTRDSYSTKMMNSKRITITIKMKININRNKLGF